MLSRLVSCRRLPCASARSPLSLHRYEYKQQQRPGLSCPEDGKAVTAVLRVPCRQLEAERAEREAIGRKLAKAAARWASG